MNNLLVGIIAGIVSAAIALILPERGGLTLFSLVSVYLTPLPILLATLGWQHQTGLVAALTGAIICAFSGLTGALIYLFCLAVPAWWLGYLFLLGRRTDRGMEWYPVGALLAWIVCISAARQFIPLLVVSGGSYEGYLEFSKEMSGQLMQALEAQLGAPPSGGQDQANREALANFLQMLLAPLWLLVNIASSWTAVKVTARTGRLPRPLPFIPGMRMPPWFLAICGTAFVAMMFIGDLPGLGARILFPMALTGLGLQGLAVLHDISQSWPQRGFALWIAYLGFLLIPFVNVLFALLGAADIVSDIRTKLRSDSPPRI